MEQRIPEMDKCILREFELKSIFDYRDYIYGIPSEVFRK